MKSWMRPAFFWSVLAFSWSLGALVQAAEYFDINNPQFQPIVIQTLQKADDPIETQTLQGIVKRNLEQTTFFRLQFTQPSPEGVLPAEKKSDFEIQLRTVQADPFEVAYALIKTKDGSTLLNGQFVSPSLDELRHKALIMSDEVFQAILGMRGLANSKIAFVHSSPDLKKNIMLLDFDGSQQQRFSYNLGINRFPAWSFDSSFLIYTNLGSEASRIHLQPVKRLKATPISVPKAEIMGGSWSPDNRKLLFALMKKGDSDIYLMDLESKQVEQLTNWDSLETSPAWSPDGKKFAFISDRIRHQQPLLYLYDFATKDIQKLPQEGKYNTSPKWSPDGQWLVYEGLVENYFQIFKMNVASGQSQQLTFGNYNSEKPDWSPNGQLLVFASEKEGKSKLFYISAQGGEMRRVTENPASIVEQDPAWSK